MKHQLYQGCGNIACDGACAKCSLDLCKVCGLAEGSLTTECPGINVGGASRAADDVYNGKLDFVGGQWREGWVSLSSPARSSNPHFLADKAELKIRAMSQQAQATAFSWTFEWQGTRFQWQYLVSWAEFDNWVGELGELIDQLYSVAQSNLYGMLIELTKRECPDQNTLP